MICYYGLLKCITTYYPVSASVTNDYPIPASVLTDYSVLDSNFMSRNKVIRQKRTTNENIRLTKISIANAKNETIDIVYKIRPELYGRNPPVGFLQNNIDEVVKNITLQKITR